MDYLEKISLKELFGYVDYISNDETDIDYFCKDDKAGKIIKQVFRETMGKNIKNERLERCIAQYEDKIDKTKLVMVLYRDYTNIIEYMEKNPEAISRDRNINHFELEFNKQVKQKTLERLRKLMIGAKETLPYLWESDHQMIVKVLDARVETNRASKTNPKNEKILQRIDRTFGRPTSKGDGLVYLLKFLNKGDLENVVFNIPGLEENLIKATATNIKDDNEENKFFIELSKRVRDVSNYIDFEKLFLMTAYRAQETVENDKYEERDLEAINLLISTIKEMLQKGQKIESDIVDKDNKMTHIEYSYDDMDEFLNGFIQSENGMNYQSKQEREELRSNLLEGKCRVDSINPNRLHKLNFTREEEFRIMSLNNENFIYLCEILNLDNHQITMLLDRLKMCNIELLQYLYHDDKLHLQEIKGLYTKESIEIEVILKFLEEENIKEFFTNQEILTQYEVFSNSENEEVKEQELQKLNRMIELYKIQNINDKKIEETKAVQDKFFEDNIEKLTADNQNMKFFFKEGLISKEEFSQWCGKSALEEMSLQELEELYEQGMIGKKEIAPKALKEIIYNPEVDYETKKEWILKGIFSRLNILDFYRNLIIYPKDFDECYEKGLVGKLEYEYEKSKRSKKDLEGKASLALEELDGMPSYKVSYPKKGTTNIKTKKRKDIILPNARVELFKLLGARRAIIKKEKENPNSDFYNYNFYTLNLNGEEGLNLDTIIIAERIYEQRELKQGLARENATYLFRYEDFLVNSNLSKKDMMRERKGIIYRANHGKSWAKSVLRKMIEIAKKDKNEKVENTWKDLIKGLSPFYTKGKYPSPEYDDSKMIDILNKAAQIDNRRIHISKRHDKNKTK